MGTWGCLCAIGKRCQPGCRAFDRLATSFKRRVTLLTSIPLVRIDERVGQDLPKPGGKFVRGVASELVSRGVGVKEDVLHEIRRIELRSQQVCSRQLNARQYSQVAPIVLQ